MMTVTKSTKLRDSTLLEDHWRWSHEVDDEILHVRQHKELFKLLGQLLLYPVGDVGETECASAECWTRLQD